MRNSVPNSITILSLILSCASIILTFNGEFVQASILIIICTVCDFLDGFTARVLKVNNPLGGQLDSLIDMVSFGVAPGLK